MNVPLVSVIIPIYNIEKYIKQSVDSILAQDYSNMEIILVDDGSTDRSGEIIDSYAKEDKRIQIISQANSGVSAARNSGLKRATGKYVHFFDGDDLLSKNFYTEAVSMLEQNNETVDLVASKIKFFDGIVDSHPLNNKFFKKRVIDLSLEPDNPLLHLTTCVFKASSIKNRSFNTNLKVSEDVTFINEVLVDKKAYGVVTKSSYYYRKRGDGSSAINGKLKNKSYYTDTPKYAYEHIFKIWKSAGSTRSAEYTFLYDLSYILTQKTQSVLSKTEENIYKKTIGQLIKKCSDEAIVGNNYLDVYQKIYALKYKYGNQFKKHLSIKLTTLYFDEYELYDYIGAKVYIDFITKKDADNYIIEGYVDAPVDLLGITFSMNGTAVERVLRKQQEQSFLGDVYDDGGAFKASFSLEVNSRFSFTVDTGDMRFILPLTTGRFTRLASHGFSYRVDGSRLVKKSNNHTVSFHKKNAMRHVFYEARLLLRILTYWKLDELLRRFTAMKTRNFAQLSYKARVFEIAKPFLFSIEMIAMIPRAFLLRFLYYLARPFKKRPIWLISDRSMMARDNGEALFRYISEQKDCPASVFFVLSKKSEDYERLNKIGKVINQESLRYKLLFLHADKIIASQAEIETTNPFFRTIDHYVDLYDFDFIFLQHGIIRHDLSAWLNRYNQNISLFITSTQNEYESIFALPYYYQKKNVLLSGLARYDYLEDTSQNTLMLAPTYRKNLVHEKTDSLGRRGYDPLFKFSEYRDFYNSLINDSRIVDALRKNNMKGEFYLHPVFSAQYPDFESNATFKVMKFPYDYNQALKEAKAIVSDYSSIVFDMAYMKKPIIYAQYDRESFFEGHSYDESDFYSDKTDGFGPVYEDYESAVAGIVALVNEKCVMQSVYSKRVDSFFYKIDKHNCRRTYDAILNMDT